MFIDRDVTACRSILNGFLSWFLCAPPPTYMRRGGPRVNIPLPVPVMITYDEEKHWYSERRLPNPNVPGYQPEEEGEEEFVQEQGNMEDADNPMDQEQVPPIVPPIIPPAAMEIVQPANLQDNQDMRAALAQIAATTALTASVDLLQKQTAVIATTLVNLTTAVTSVATGIATLVAAQSRPPPSVSASVSSIVQPVASSELEIMEMVTTEQTSAPSTVTKQVTTGPIQTTTVTTTGPISSTTTTTTRRKSAVSVPTSVPSSFGTGMNQASGPSLTAHLVSAESTLAAPLSSTNGGPASEPSPASSLTGETQGLVQSKEEKKETESNTQNQTTQDIGNPPDQNSLLSSTNTATESPPFPLNH
jgi:hypothetical protein